MITTARNPLVEDDSRQYGTRLRHVTARCQTLGRTRFAYRCTFAPPTLSHAHSYLPALCTPIDIPVSARYAMLTRTEEETRLELLPYVDFQHDVKAVTCSLDCAVTSGNLWTKGTRTLCVNHNRYSCYDDHACSLPKQRHWARDLPFAAQIPRVLRREGVTRRQGSKSWRQRGCFR